MLWFRFGREADSRTQRKRQPIRDPVEFRKRVEECHACLQVDPAAAVPLAEALTQMEPERALPWFLLAMSLGQSGQPAEALDAINHAILIDPTDDEKWAVKAYALSDLGRQDEAREAIGEAKCLRERADTGHSDDTDGRGVFKKKDG